ncbi:hypothetical protein SPAR_03601 [Streptomyces sparsogenes DSM 40356]|uniref:Uncharacterized protein n=2 Tax=Streptomyces sparsogenes TaxID=67365 RepID=A0A1R1SRG7_9ACTN|nr:hypothetical protein SPAR_03601 [Streptomyces sparsogenes DSM 40356]
MQEAELAQGLAAAGLTYLGMVEPSAPLIPPRLAAFANSAAAEGEEWAASVESDAPDFQERFNHEWYMLAADQGLFSREDPQFLFASAEPESGHGASWWARVALRAEWDLAGAGAAAQVTGCGWGHPEFVMLSLDGNVIVRGSQGEKWTDVVCLRNPHRIRSLREMGARMTDSGSIPRETREAIARWLAHAAPDER